MANSLKSIGFVRHAAIDASQLAFTTLASFWAKARRTAQSVIMAMQTARMLSVLSNMSDEQLAEIGISRSDVPDYAGRLIAEDWKD